MDPLALGTLTQGTGSKSVDDNLCIELKGTSDPRYVLSAYGSGSGGAFTMANGPYELALQVFWNGDDTTSGNTELLPNNAKNFQLPPGELKCENGTNANIQVTVSAGAIAAARAGNYSGTIFLTISTP